jgi:hypothetical protein
VKFEIVREGVEELGSRTVRMVEVAHGVEVPMVRNARGYEVVLGPGHNEKERVLLSQQTDISRECPPTPPNPLSEKPPAPHVLDELKLMRTRPTYENVAVFVGPGLMKWKGLRGLVVGWHDSTARAERHAKLRKRGKEPKDDQAGILLTIRPTASMSMASSVPVADIPIEHVYHELYVVYESHTLP